MDIINDERLSVLRNPTHISVAHFEATGLDELPAEAGAGPDYQFSRFLVEEVERPLLRCRDGHDGRLDGDLQHLLQVEDVGQPVGHVGEEVEFALELEPLLAKKLQASVHHLTVVEDTPIL